MLKFISLISVVLVLCPSYRSHETPQTWARVLQKSASEPNVYKPPQGYHNKRSKSASRLGDCVNDYNFNYIMLSLNWAPGYCRTSPNACVRMEKKHFIIHGMWPSMRDSSGPAFCCFDNTFNIKELQPIMNDLSEYWPTLFSQNNGGFWSHEWLKHGTCAKNAPTMRGELNYFSSTLKIFKSLHILESLKAANIVPSANRVYQAGDIQNALRQINKGSRVQISCDLEHDQRIPVLTGINFCFDTNMNPTDCRPNKSRCSREIRFVD